MKKAYPTYEDWKAAEGDSWRDRMRASEPKRGSNYTKPKKRRKKRR